MSSSIGWQELLIIGVVPAINFAVPAALVILAVVFMKRSEAPQSPPVGYLDVRRWSTSTAGWVLAGTVYPVVAGVAWISYFIAGLDTDPFASGPIGGGGIVPLFGAAALGALVGFTMLVVYLIVAIRSPLSDTVKVLWCLAVVAGGIMAYPFAFYYLIALPRRTPEAVAIPADQHGSSGG